MQPTLYVGIDPGVSGAIGAVGPGFLHAVNTPTIKAKTGAKTKSGNAKRKSQYNEHEMVLVLEGYRAFAAENNLRLSAILEDVHSMPKDSKPGCFSFGESKGIWRGMLAALHIPYVMVSPARWRPRMVGQGTDKAMSLVVAQRMFPSVDLSRKSDHNRAEALLLATYLARVEEGANSVRAYSIDESTGEKKTRKVLRRKVPQDSSPLT